MSIRFFESDYTIPVQTFKAIKMPSNYHLFSEKKPFCNSFLFLFQEYNRHSELLKPESNAIDHGPSNYKSGKTPKTFIFSLHTQMLYMSSSFWMLGIESRDFSCAEKKRTTCKAEQIHKITTTLFPRIVFAKTILFWFWHYELWPLVIVHKSVETIQGRKLFKGGNYLRRYGIITQNDFLGPFWV